MRPQLVPDRLDEMGLAEADATVDKQRVIGGTRPLSDLSGCSARQIVRLTGHERVETEGRVQARHFAAGRLCSHWLSRVSGHRARCGLLVREQEFHSDHALEMLPRECFDPLREFVANPLLHQTVRRDEGDGIGIDVALERFDPGSKLRGRKFLLEGGQAEAPEAVHRYRLGGGIRTRSRRLLGRVLAPQFYLFWEQLSTAPGSFWDVPARTKQRLEAWEILRCSVVVPCTRKCRCCKRDTAARVNLVANACAISCIKPAAAGTGIAPS